MKKGDTLQQKQWRRIKRGGRERIRILVVDDHLFAREGIRCALKQRGNLTVVGAVETGEEALAAARELLPDIISLEVKLPGMDGLQVAELLAAELPQIKVIILTGNEQPGDVVRAVRAGVRGYLQKSMSVMSLVTAIEKVAAGECLVSEEMAFAMEKGRKWGKLGLSLLSEREREVLKGIASGMTISGIAAELGIESRTVETYRLKLKTKLRIRTVAELTKFAIASALVAAEPVAEMRDA